MKWEILQQLKSPTTVWYEPTRVCTGFCADCHTTGDDKFDSGTAIKILDALKKADILHLSFAGGLDLKDPDIQKVIRYAANLDFSINYVGCAGVITPETAQICESLGIDKVVHCLHSEVPSNIEEIIKKMVYHNLIYKLQVALTANTLDFCETLDSKIHDLTRVLKVIVTFSRSELTSKDFLAKVSREIDKVMDGSRYVVDFEPSIPPCTGNAHANLCGAALITCAVNRDGDVFPCQKLRVKVGNILETPLDSLWRQTEIMSTLRQPVDKHPCNSCKYRSILCVGGCKAITYAKTKTLNVPDPIAVENDGGT